MARQTALKALVYEADKSAKDCVEILVRPNNDALHDRKATLGFCSAPLKGH